MVSDIQRMVDSGMELWDAITENIRKPIMNKPEYKKIMSDKFGVNTSKNLVNIWWVDYLMDEQGNFFIANITLSLIRFMIYTGLRFELIS